MGKGARVREERRRRSRSQSELWDVFHEHRTYLRSSAASFDAGYEPEAKRMAVSLRVLLHDTPQSISVFKQLGLKDSWTFDDTAGPVNPRNMAPTTGLVMMRTQITNGAAEGMYVALLAEGSPSPSLAPIRFSGWWMNPVAKLDNGDTWSRKDYVKELANKEGGAHVDPELTAAYETLALHNGFGWSAGTSPDDGQPFGGNAVHASVRQITYELLLTIERELSNTPPVEPMTTGETPCFQCHQAITWQTPTVPGTQRGPAG